MRNEYTILVGMLEGNKKRRMKGDIKMGSDRDLEVWIG
jgi:hypothetical protein